MKIRSPAVKFNRWFRPYSGFQKGATCAELPCSIGFALKARRILAGGEQSVTTGFRRKSLASPGGATDRSLVQRPYQGAILPDGLTRWFRFASPPANVQCPCRGKQWKRPHSIENGYHRATFSLRQRRNRTREFYPVTTAPGSVWPLAMMVSSSGSSEMKELCLLKQ